MKEKIKRSQVIKKRIVKSILWLVLTPFILLGTVALLIHLPPVQNYLTDRVTTYLSEGTGYDTEIDYINIKWFNAVSIDGTQIYDLNDVKMIGIDELVLTFKLEDIIGKSNIKTKDAWVKGADVNLRDQTTLRLNIDDWVIKLSQLLAGDNTSSAAAGSFTIDQITLIDSKFSISDKTRDSVKTGFDYNHFQLLDLNADLLNLKAVADTFQIDVKRLSARDSSSGFKIDQLKTFFRNSWKGMAFYELDLQMGKSRITNEVVFNHDRPGLMGYFVDSVYIEANLDGTIIHSDELSYFAPELKGYDESVKIDGFFEGEVRDFFSNEFKLNFGDGTELAGEMQIEGLPDLKVSGFDILLNNSTLVAKDLEEYIGDRAFDISNKLGQVRLNGSFTGFLNNFVAEGRFDTDIGSFTSNTQITVDADALPTYEGKLETEDFDLGVFTGDPVFQKINMTGNIEGSGFTLEDANFTLGADIPSIGINGYDYQNIVIEEGKFEQSFFSGDLDVSDPNLTLIAKGSIDLRDNKKIFNVRGELDTAQLKTLNLTEEDITLASNFSLDLTGIKLDSIIGSIYLNDTYLKYEENDIVFDSLLFSSQRNDTERDVRFISDQFNAAFIGEFEFTTLLSELENINDQYKLVFSSRRDEAIAVAEKNKASASKFNIRYDISLDNISPVLQLFDTSIYVSKNALIQGRFTNDLVENFTLNAEADSVKWANIRFFTNSININSNNLKDLNNVLTLGQIQSKQQRYANTAETEALDLIAIWDGQKINIEQKIQQESSGNSTNIKAEVDFYKDSTILSFQEAQLVALNEEWNISENNRILFGERRIDIKNLSITNKDQSISFDGAVAVTKDSAKTLGIEFNDVSVANLNTLTTKSYTGSLNGKLQAQNLYFNPLLFGDVEVSELKINNFLVGDLKGSLNWSDINKKFDVNFDVDRNEERIIHLVGDFFPSKKTDQLNLNLSLNDANLRIAEPFIEDYVSEIGGFMSGDYAISGNFNAPVMKGEGYLEQGEMKVNYLNTDYKFDGLVEFQKDLILLSDIAFKDVEDHEANFNGSITHNAFKNFALDMSGDLTQFQVLNTEQDLSEPYYGTAYGTGTINLNGEASNLTIEANVRTDENTRLIIPISEGSDITDNPEYITFINRTDTTKTIAIDESADEVNKIKIEGLKLDLDINVTPDAYVEIIIDPKSGDILRGRSNGQLRLNIDTQGDFQMTGGLDIIEGGYNFSLYNIITKEFDIERPSSITWFGDPYSAIMDIQASYTQSTSLQPILEQTGLTSPESDGISRRFPTKILLGLEGPMLSPKFNFDIDLSAVQGVENQVAINAFKSIIQSDEQELNRQVLSLIVLNRFSDQGGLTIGGNTPTQNVSQFLSNQFSQLIAQLDENLEVDLDLDLQEWDEEAFNTFRLRLSYTFLDGRLRITREGGLVGFADVNNIAGDLTAEYLLTEDGRYKVKVYSRNNYNLLNSAISNSSTTTTTGASITQTTSFNSLKEFFSGVNRNRKKKKKGNKEENNQPGPN
ncbi:translocation/assembly module TamB domain-containing protein [Roseivirga sp.]|uniref:translocation/assembly module TamB domain-containing protein n=1 Tax=Roseivirga sp. TaxID=1964215 RepID=UPI003B8E44CB